MTFSVQHLRVGLPQSLKDRIDIHVHQSFSSFTVLHFNFFFLRMSKTNAKLSVLSLAKEDLGMSICMYP